jgi:hypothetical protein
MSIFHLKRQSYEISIGVPGHKAIAVPSAVSGPSGSEFGGGCFVVAYLLQLQCHYAWQQLAFYRFKLDAAQRKYSAAGDVLVCSPLSLYALV